MKRRRFHALAVLPLAAAPLGACAVAASTTRAGVAASPAGPAPAGQPAASPGPVGARPDLQRSAQLQLAVRLLGAIAAPPPEGNLAFSPYSIASALAMVAAGARGDTAAEIHGVLALPADEMAGVFAWTDGELGRRGQGQRGADDGPFRLRIANDLWLHRDVALEPAFQSTLTRQFGAAARGVDFGRAAEARATINGHVARATEQRIPALLDADALTPATRLVLTNAVVLNAAWQSPFSGPATRDLDFTRLSGAVVKLPTMSRQGPMRAGRGPGYVAAALPYSDARLEMVIVVPDRGSFAAFTRGLTAELLGSVLRSLEERDVELRLPRFRVAATVGATAALRVLGLQRAFDRAAADFSGISRQERLHLQAVVHQAFVQVAEKGTEAAAATAAVMGLTSAMPPPREPLQVFADRPFLFLLRDVPTGAVLFAGRVTDPGAG